jgi:hypothetical protein
MTGPRVELRDMATDANRAAVMRLRRGTRPATLMQDRPSGPLRGAVRPSREG